MPVPPSTGSVLSALALLLVAPGPRAVRAEFPKDLVPLNIVTEQVSQEFPTFRGLNPDNGSSGPSLDLQRLLRVNQTLYVAARNHVFSFDLGMNSKEGLVPRRVLTWKTRSTDMQNCAMRGKMPDECHNYIRVLVTQNDRSLFICGTNAFNPVCRTYKMNSLIQEGKEVNGQARGPFESKQTNVALFSEGNLYSATMADFLASDAVIYRSLGDKPFLRTVKYDSKWLKEPHFVRAIDYGHHVYFFFREVAIEYTTLGRVLFSRVARVCKNDRGGSPRVLEKYWTSFLKVRLNCSVPGDSFFYFDVLESMTEVVTIRGRPTVVAIFSTQPNSIPGSAVCAFAMDDIERSFSGRFKEQVSADSPWIAVPEGSVPKPRPGHCAGHGEAGGYKTTSEFPDDSLSFIKSHPLLDETVRVETGRPWLTRTSSRSPLVSVTVDGAAGPHGNHTVMLVVTADGRMLKVLPPPPGGERERGVVIEEVTLPTHWCDRGREDCLPRAVELDKDHHSVFIGYRGSLVRVSLSRCEMYSYCKRACIASRDPYCGWLKSGRCGTLHPGTRGGFEQDVERGHVGGQEQCRGLTPSLQDGLQDSSYGVQRGVSQGGGEERVHINLLLAATVMAFGLGALASGLALSWYRRRAEGRRAEGGPGEGGGGDAAAAAAAKAKAEERIYASLLVSRASAYPELVGMPTPEGTPELQAKGLRPFRSQWDRPQSENRPQLASAPVVYAQPFIPSAMVLPNNALGRQTSPAWLADEDMKDHSPPPPPLPHRFPEKLVDVSTLDELLQHLHEMNLRALRPLEDPLGPVAVGDGGDGEEVEGEGFYHTASTLPRGRGRGEGASPSLAPSPPPHQRRSLATFPKASPAAPRLPKHHSFTQARGCPTSSLRPPYSSSSSPSPSSSSSSSPPSRSPRQQQEQPPPPHRRHRSLPRRRPAESHEPKPGPHPETEPCGPSGSPDH